jgi:hypothetical protein
MSNIPQVSQTLHRVLTDVAEKAATTTGLVKRRSKLTGSVFTQTLVFGWLADPKASLSSLTQMAATLGVQLSPQALFQRFNPQAAGCLQQVLEGTLEEMIAAEPVAIPILKRFSAVVVQDSSIIMLPDALQEVWAGCGGTNSYGKSALKLQVRLDLSTGLLLGPFLDHGRVPDSNSWVQRAPLPRGALRIADLGYFRLDTFRELAEQGSYFLSRLKAGTKLYQADGTGLDLSSLLTGGTSHRVDLPVLVGRAHHLSARLLAVRVPQEVSAQRRRQLKDQARKKRQPLSQTRLAWCDWTILITNVPQSLLSLDEALILARTRWQIELLFKLWKQRGGIDKWRSENPWRILCEVYAKLIAMVILHWTLLTCCWMYPHRSLVKAAQTIRTYAIMLACSMTGIIATAAVIRQISLCLSSGCRIERRRQRPSAYQLLLALTDDSLA